MKAINNVHKTTIGTKMHALVLLNTGVRLDVQLVKRILHSRFATALTSVNMMNYLQMRFSAQEAKKVRTVKASMNKLVSHLLNVQKVSSVSLSMELQSLELALFV